jgi:hypothetical protein
MSKRKGYLGLFISLSLVILMASCSSNGNSSAPGTLGVSLTDKPTSVFSAVNVTVTKVRVHQSANASENDPGWTDIAVDPARKINLLNLANGVLEDLGQTSLAAGHYTQLRLVLQMNTDTTPPANSVVLSGTSDEISLITPSAVQSGIKLIHEFDVAAGQRIDLVIDFDAWKSIVELGNGGYLLRPVIKIVPKPLTGIDGFVDISLLNSNVMVSSQVSGTVKGSTIPNAQTGEFFIALPDPGNYDLVITADGHATAVVAGVPVPTATSTALVTMVSTSTEPISLPTSTMQTITGGVSLSPPSPSPTIATVAAKQNFSGGPTVTVKSQDILLPLNAYSLALPSASPLLGEFGTGTLPIALNPQSGIAGKYDVEASAEGYQTQSAPNVNISSGDVIQTFILHH